MQCKTAFVTGAGSGIGLALAETLARRGARIAAFDLRFSDEARARLRKVCPDALFLEVDVRDAAGVAAAVNKAVAQIGAPDVAINSAGVQVARPFLEISSERLRLRHRRQPEGQSKLCRGSPAAHAQRRAPALWWRRSPAS